MCSNRSQQIFTLRLHFENESKISRYINTSALLIFAMELMIVEKCIKFIGQKQLQPLKHFFCWTFAGSASNLFLNFGEYLMVGTPQAYHKHLWVQFLFEFRDWMYFNNIPLFIIFLGIRDLRQQKRCWFVRKWEINRLRTHQLAEKTVDQCSKWNTYLRGNILGVAFKDFVGFDRE